MSPYRLQWPPINQPQDSMITAVTPENMQRLAPDIENFIQFELIGQYYAYLNSEGNPENMRAYFDCHFPIRDTQSEELQENMRQKRREFVREADAALTQILHTVYMQCPGRIQILKAHMEEEHKSPETPTKLCLAGIKAWTDFKRLDKPTEATKAEQTLANLKELEQAVIYNGDYQSYIPNVVRTLKKFASQGKDCTFIYTRAFKDVIDNLRAIDETGVQAELGSWITSQIHRNATEENFFYEGEPQIEDFLKFHQHMMNFTTRGTKHPIPILQAGQESSGKKSTEAHHSGQKRKANAVFSASVKQNNTPQKIRRQQQENFTGCKICKEKRLPARISLSHATNEHDASRIGERATGNKTAPTMKRITGSISTGFQTRAGRSAKFTAKSHRSSNPNRSNEESGQYPKSKYKQTVSIDKKVLVNLTKALQEATSTDQTETQESVQESPSSDEDESDEPSSSRTPPKRLKEVVKETFRGTLGRSSRKNKSPKEYPCSKNYVVYQSDTRSKTDEIQLHKLDAALFSKVSKPWYLEYIFHIPRLLIRNTDRYQVFLHALKAKEQQESLYAIVDSGATVSVLCNPSWLQRSFTHKTEITGVGGSKINTSLGGILAGTIASIEGKRFAFATIATVISDENAKINLLSIWRITNSGHTIIHKGKPEGGLHGIITLNNEFIPFYFCPSTYLWYVEIQRPNRKTNKIISKLSAKTIWDKDTILREIQEGEIPLTATIKESTQTTNTQSTSKRRIHLIIHGARLESVPRWGGSIHIYQAAMQGESTTSATAFKPTHMKTFPISMRDVRPELDTSEESDSENGETLDSCSSSDDELMTTDNTPLEPARQFTTEEIQQQTKEYLNDPRSFTDFDDFTNTTIEELDENDKEYEEQLKNDKSDLKNIYLYSTGERIKGTRASAILLKWHVRTNHIGKKYLFQLAENIEGMEELKRINPKTPLPTCHTCRRAKTKAAPLPKFRHKRSDVRFHRLHGDMSSYRVRSIEGAKYLQLWKDDFSGFKMPVGLASKKGYRKSLRLVVTRFNNGVYPKVIRVDNGSEMVSKKSLKMYEKHNIHLERSAPYEHWQNGRAESGIYSLDTRTRLAIVHSNVPKNLWLSAIYYNAEIENAFLPTSRNSNISCYQAFTGTSPNAEHFHPFGCLCYVHILKDRRLDQKKDKKLEPTAEVCVFLGFAHHLGMKGYLAAALNGKQLYVTQNNISFNEEVFPYRFSHPEDRSWKIPYGGTDDFGDDNVIVLKRAGERLIEMSDTSDASDSESEDAGGNSSAQPEERNRRPFADQQHGIAHNDPMVIQVRQQAIEVDNHLTRTCSETSVVRESDITQDEQVAVDPGLSERGHMNRELASLQVETYNSGEKDFEWDKLTQIPEHQLRSGRIVQKTNVDTPTSDSDHEDNDLPAGIEEFDNQDFINATLLPSGSTLEFLTNLGIPYQDRTLTKRQYCGVLVDTYNNLEEKIMTWSHGPPQRNMYNENHYNEEIDSLMSFLQGCKKDERRESRIQKAQLFYTGMLSATSHIAFDNDEPSIKEALNNNNPERHHWITAIQSEARSWNGLKVFEEVDNIPDGRKAIGCRIILKRKRGPNGEVLKYKARAIIQGYNAVQGIDYLDSFSATANPVTIRLLLTIARANKWHVRCQDISTAYLMAPLPTVVYIRTPKEFQEFCNIRAAYLKILSSVYGLPSSGRNFWKKLCQDLRDFGFKACTSDDCLFLYHDEQGGEIIIALVVDDIIQASNSQALFAKFDDFMMNTKGYSVTTDNDLSFYLGVAYKRDEAGDFISNQQAYIEKCLKRFNLEGIDPTGKFTTPMDPKFVIEPEDVDPHAPEDLVKIYRSQVASLIYIATWSRPEISYAVSLLSRYLTSPTKKLLMAVHRVYAYLKNTKTLGIRYTDNDDNGHKKMELVAFCDSSDADCKLTSRSTGGYVIFLNGTPISWKSARHNTVSLSTMESEYIQSTLTAIEILYLRETLEFMGYKQPTTICYQDNAACIKLSENPVSKSRSKHIKRRHHFIRQCVANKEITLEAIHTSEQVADIFTKPLPADQFLYLRDQLLNLPEAIRYQRKTKK